MKSSSRTFQNGKKAMAKELSAIKTFKNRNLRTKIQTLKL